MTRNNIEINLTKSPFRCIYSGIEFRFSSKLHRNKFVSGLKDFQTQINDSLSNRFKFKITANVLSAVLFYRKVETRGFYINDGGVCYTCPEGLQFAGGEMILKSSQTLLEDTIVLLHEPQTETRA